jgi:formylglycine-generating enzyme required for sulfatase activity
MAFCNWLTEVEQKAGRLPHGMVYRLPTEAEWEYAARGGRATRFWWGDEVEEGQGRLNWRGTDDGFETLMPVDHFDSGGRNTFGLADMLGNVWEWCLDHYDPGGAHADLYRAQGNRYVMRGGSFLHQVAYNRCAARPGFGPDIPQACTGFRVCCGVEPKPESQ